MSRGKKSTACTAFPGILARRGCFQARPIATIASLLIINIMTSVKDVKSKEEFDALSANGAQVRIPRYSFRLLIKTSQITQLFAWPCE